MLVEVVALLEGCRLPLETTLLGGETSTVKISPVSLARSLFSFSRVLKSLCYIARFVFYGITFEFIADILLLLFLTIVEAAIAAEDSFCL